MQITHEYKLTRTDHIKYKHSPAGHYDNAVVELTRKDVEDLVSALPARSAVRGNLSAIRAKLVTVLDTEG